MTDDNATLHYESAVVLLYFPDRNTQCCSGTIFPKIPLCHLFYNIPGACGDMTEEVSYTAGFKMSVLNELYQRKWKWQII